MDMGRDPYEYLRSGDAWRDYCAELAEAGQDLVRELAPDSPIDVADGHRYLARMVRFGLEFIPVVAISLNPPAELVAQVFEMFSNRIASRDQVVRKP